MLHGNGTIGAMIVVTVSLALREVERLCAARSGCVLVFFFAFVCSYSISVFPHPRIHSTAILAFRRVCTKGVSSSKTVSHGSEALISDSMALY